MAATQLMITDQGLEAPRDLLNVENYNTRRGIWSPLTEHKNTLTGFWMPGNHYMHVVKYYGAYPPDYLDRMRILFPLAQNVLHIFSGKVITGNWPNEKRVDVNTEIEADYHFDVSNADAWPSTTYDLILADPPYEDNHEKYGTEKVNKKRVVKNCAKYLRKGGYLVWLDTRIPIWAKADGWRLRGTIGLVQSTNCLTKVITILERYK